MVLKKSWKEFHFSSNLQRWVPNTSTTKYSPERNPPKKRESDLASIFWDLSQSDKLYEIKPLLPDTSVRNVLCNSWSSADYFLFLQHLKVKTSFLEKFTNFKLLIWVVLEQSRRACGLGDVGTCPHQDLTATVALILPGGADYAHHILMSTPSFESHRHSWTVTANLRLITSFSSHILKWRHVFWKPSAIKSL